MKWMGANVAIMGGVGGVNLLWICQEMESSRPINPF